VKWDVFAGQDPDMSFSGSVIYGSDENNDARYVFAMNGGDYLFMVVNKDGDNVGGAKSVGILDYEFLKADILKIRTEMGNKYDPPRTASPANCAGAIAISSMELIGLTALAALAPVAALAGAYAAGFITLGNMVGVVIGASAAGLTVLGTVYKGVVAIKDDVVAVPKACSSKP